VRSSLDSVSIAFGRPVRIGFSFDQDTDEGLAREVVASALGSPSTEEVRLANEANFLMGREATIVAVNFSVDEVSAKLVETDGKVVNG
jgi:hypothetical protein